MYSFRVSCRPSPLAPALPCSLQVSLYLLLLEQRYKHHVGSGLLCNLHSPQLQAVQHSDVDIAHLLNR